MRLCVCVAKEQFTSKKHAMNLKVPLLKEPAEEQTSYCKKITEKSSLLERAANKDVRASSTRFLPNTCNVFSLLNNTTRPPFVIAWTVLNLDHAQLNGFWSFWSYKADEKWADWEGQKGESAHLDMDSTYSQEQRQKFVISQRNESWRSKYILTAVRNGINSWEIYPR